MIRNFPICGDKNQEKSCHSPTFHTTQVLHELVVAGAYNTTLSAQTGRGQPQPKCLVALLNAHNQKIDEGRLVLACAVLTETGVCSVVLSNTEVACLNAKSIAKAVFVARIDVPTRFSTSELSCKGLVEVFVSALGSFRFFFHLSMTRAASYST